MPTNTLARRQNAARIDRARQAQFVEPWPGSSRRLSQIFNLVLTGRIPANLSDASVRRHVFYHRQQYANAGNQQLNFFQNQAAADFTCNFPNNGVLPNEQAFALKRVHVVVETGLTVAGAADAAGAQIATGATLVAPATLAEEVRRVLVSGLLKVKVGDKEIINCRDLTNFHAGHGFFSMPALATNSATTLSQQALPFCNGMPVPGAGWEFMPMWPVPAGKPVQCSLNWATGTLTVTTAILTISVELEGYLVTPANY